MATLEELQAEAQKRGLTTSTESVLDPEKTSFQEFKNFAESSLKGIPSGIINMVGGWGNLYDSLKESKDPSAFSSTGIKQALSKLTGINVQSIPGYRGAYQFTEAGAPAAAATALGVPGLFNRTLPGVAGEFGVAGSTGLFAQTVAPESPLAQLALQTTPYAVKGGAKIVGGMLTKPEGTFPSVADTQTLSQVGRLTPGELSLNRPQLATEAAIESAPASGQKPIQFRQAQAGDVESYLTNLFNKVSGKTLNPTQTTEEVFTSFANYGKSLTSKLRSDAKTDFNAAKSAGGMIDTTPVVDAITSKLGELDPEMAAFDTVKNAMQRIVNEYSTPAVPAQNIPSTILNSSGQPASVNVIPGSPAQNISIDIDRLQKNLSTWGEAVYSGNANFGKGNIFDGVAPGQVKNISLAVLNGFRESLDQAIANKVPGADKLVAARDKFKTNIARIEEFANRPLTKAFDKEKVTELVPEDVMRDLKTMPPSQRKFLIEVMQSNPNTHVTDVLNSIRRSKFDDILSSAQVKGGATTDPTFNIKTVLTELNKKDSTLNDLFPFSKDLNQAKLAMNWMGRVLSSESPQMAGITGSEAYAFTGAAGGGAQTRLALKETIPYLRNLIANPADFADVIFNPDYRKAMVDLSTQKTMTKKAVDALGTLTKGLAIMSARGGGMMAEPPTDSSIQKPTNIQPTTPVDQNQELIDELKSRGYQVE
jgi:hypothetical protein